MRLYELLRDARFVLATTAAVDIDRPSIVRATYSDPASRRQCWSVPMAMPRGPANGLPAQRKSQRR
jgi:hypothetical protein